MQANVEATESRQRQAAIRYVQTLQNAFREVGDALVEHARIIEVREYRELYETTLADQFPKSEINWLLLSKSGS